MKTNSDSDTDDEATKQKRAAKQIATTSNSPHGSSENTRIVIREQIVDAVNDKDRSFKMLGNLKSANLFVVDQRRQAAVGKKMKEYQQATQASINSDMKKTQSMQSLMHGSKSEAKLP